MAQKEANMPNGRLEIRFTVIQTLEEPMIWVLVLLATNNQTLIMKAFVNSG